MLNQSVKVPGSRVLEGPSGGKETAIAVPKGRPLAAQYAREFVEAAIDKAELHGVVVAANR